VQIRFVNAATPAAAQFLKGMVRYLHVSMEAPGGSGGIAERGEQRPFLEPYCPGLVS
jgi:hypothetical protein